MTGSRTKKALAPDSESGVRASRVKDPGDDRLSRFWHYHGPGGLNGRVRNGNGCFSARMVAGEAAAAGFPAAVAGQVRSISVFP